VKWVNSVEAASIRVELAGQLEMTLFFGSATPPEGLGLWARRFGPPTSSLSEALSH
jgi:hypothetical protein